MILQWLKRLFENEPTSKSVARQGNSKAAHSHLVIHHDGRTEEFLSGSVAYGKGCEPVGGHKPVTTIESK